MQITEKELIEILFHAIKQNNFVFLHLLFRKFYKAALCQQLLRT